MLLLTGNKVSMDISLASFSVGSPAVAVWSNLISSHLDKLKPENHVWAYEYLKALFTLYPKKMIFVGEKHLRGEELSNQKV